MESGLTLRPGFKPSSEGTGGLTHDAFEITDPQKVSFKPSSEGTGGLTSSIESQQVEGLRFQALKRGDGWFDGGVGAILKRSVYVSSPQGGLDESIDSLRFFVISA